MLSERPAAAHKPVVGSLPVRWHTGQRSDALVRSPLFCGDLLHDLDFQIPLSQQLLQPSILLRQVLQFLDFINSHAGKPLAPAINALLGYPVPLGHLGYRILIRFTQNPDDLFVAVSALLHCSPFAGSYLLKFQLVRKYRGRSRLLKMCGLPR